MSSGRCKVCGLCCRYIAADIEEGSNNTWLAYHGIIWNKHGKAFIPCRCLMLTEDNLCSIYEDRPQNCRDIPNDMCNQAQPPGCRFYED
jgi:Fe-S-cluster containining protein